MSRTDPQLKVRLPLEMKEKLEKASKENRRSMNAEIVARLAGSLGYINLTKDSDLEAVEPDDDIEKALKALDDATERLLRLRKLGLSRINSKNKRSKMGLKASESDLADD